MKLFIIALTLVAYLWAADPPKSNAEAKSVILTDSDKLEIRTLQLRSARVDAAKLQIAAEEKAVNETLQKIVQAWAAKGCLLQDDLTCAPKPEPKKEK